MAGKYGYKPDGDRYWNVRDGEGQFAKGWGMASAVAKVAKKISDLKLPPITGDYSAAEKKKLRAQRRKIGQKMLDNGWQPDQVQNALSGSPTNWPKLSEIKSPKNMAPTVPKEPADSVSKALRIKEKALAMHPEPDPADKSLASPNKVPGVDAPALTIKDLKLPTIEGDDLTAQQKKNLRSQRRKLAQKMIDSGWTKDQILAKLGPDPKAWPALKDIKQVTPEDTPQTFAKVAPKPIPKDPLEHLLGQANLLKSTPGITPTGFALHSLLNKMKGGTASPAEVKKGLDNFDKYKLSASYLSDPQDKADALAALGQIEKALQDHLNATPKAAVSAPKPAAGSKVDDAASRLMDSLLSPYAKEKIKKAQDLLNMGATLMQNEKAMSDLHEVKKFEVDYMSEGEREEAESNLAALENALMKQNNELMAKKPTATAKKPTAQPANDKYLKDLAKKLDFLAPTEGDVSNWPVTGGQKGSNPGAKLKDPDTGQEYYVKTPKTESHVQSEVLANKLYAAFGVGAPEVAQVSYKGKPATSSKMIESSGESVLAKMKEDPEFRKEVQKGFAIDALLGNWDVAGASLDNIIVGKDGKPYRIDNGGSLNYRAQGSKKPGGGLSDDPQELYTLRNPSKNYQAAKLFGDMTDDEIKASVSQLAKVSDAHLRAMAQGSMPGAEGKKLGDTLVKRKQAILKEALNLKPVNQPTSQTFTVVTDAPSASSSAQSAYKPKPKAKSIPFTTPSGSPFELKIEPHLSYNDKVVITTDGLSPYTINKFSVKVDPLEAILGGQSKNDYLASDAEGLAKPEVQAALAAMKDFKSVKGKGDFLNRLSKVPKESRPYVKKLLSQMEDHPTYGKFSSWVPPQIPMGEAVPLNPQEGDYVPWTNPVTGMAQPMKFLYTTGGKAYLKPIDGSGSIGVDFKEMQFSDLSPELAQKAVNAGGKASDYDQAKKYLNKLYDLVDERDAKASQHAEFLAKAQKNAESAAAYQKLSPEEKAKFVGMANSPRVKKALALKHTGVLGARSNTLPSKGKDNLTTPQYDALRSYTGGGYADINNTYRPQLPDAKPVSPSFKNQAARIDEVMKQPSSRTKQEMLVTRGITLDKFTAAGFGLPYVPQDLDQFMEIKDALVGQTFKDDGYLSTSYMSGKFSAKTYDYTKHAPAFDKEIRLNIVVPPGIPALNVAKMSATSSKEREVILDRGGEMVVQDMAIRDGKLHVDVVLVSTANTPKETI